MDLLIKRSFELESELVEFLRYELSEDSPRHIAAHVLSSIAFEHASSAKALISSSHVTSAIALFRLQYEALVKAIWYYYAATDTAIEKLFTIVNQENFSRLSRMPNLGILLEQLAKKLPDDVITRLHEFRDHSWKPLNSYVHGGVMAFQTHIAGFPPDLLRTAIKISNGVSVMAANLLFILTNDGAHQGKISALQERFADALPELIPA